MCKATPIPSTIPQVEFFEEKIEHTCVFSRIWRQLHVGETALPESFTPFSITALLFMFDWRGRGHGFSNILFRKYTSYILTPCIALFAIIEGVIRLALAIIPLLVSLIPSPIQAQASIIAANLLVGSCYAFGLPIVIIVNSLTDAVYSFIRPPRDAIE